MASKRDQFGVGRQADPSSVGPCHASCPEHLACALEIMLFDRRERCRWPNPLANRGQSKYTGSSG